MLPLAALVGWLIQLHWYDALSGHLFSSSLMDPPVCAGSDQLWVAVLYIGALIFVH